MWLASEQIRKMHQRRLGIGKQFQKRRQRNRQQQSGNSPEPSPEEQSHRRCHRCLIGTHPQIAVVGEAADFATTMLMTEELKPHIVVMDLHMPDGDAVTPQEFKAHPSFVMSRILAISVWSDEDTQDLADRFGAARLLDKANLSADLIPAILEFADRS